MFFLITYSNNVSQSTETTRIGRIIVNLVILDVMPTFRYIDTIVLYIFQFWPAIKVFS